MDSITFSLCGNSEKYQFIYKGQFVKTFDLKFYLTEIYLEFNL